MPLVSRASKKATQKRPNGLFILVDDLGAGDMAVDNPVYRNTLFGELILKLVNDGKTDMLDSIK